MKLVNLFSGVALAIAAISSQAAVGPLDLSSGSASFGNSPLAGSFTDTATFTLTSLSVLNGGVISALNGNQDVDFLSISISGPSGTFAFTQLSPDPVEVWSTPTAGFVLAPGGYTLTLTGVNSAGGGSYAGTLAVTPVPEPTSLALLLGGLGVVGFVSRRRIG